MRAVLAERGPPALSCPDSFLLPATNSCIQAAGGVERCLSVWRWGLPWWQPDQCPSSQTSCHKLGRRDVRTSAWRWCCLLHSSQRTQNLQKRKQRVICTLQTFLETIDHLSLSILNDKLYMYVGLSNCFLIMYAKVCHNNMAECEKVQDGRKLLQGGAYSLYAALSLCCLII